MWDDTDYSTELLRNVHNGLPDPGPGETTLVKGDYEYWHYGCDGFQDQGWGCGYRTLQTVASWFEIYAGAATNTKLEVPSILEIQEILVDLEDKDASFIESTSWIGSFEVCLVLDHRYDVRSKLLHIAKGKDLAEHTERIKKHFQTSHCPIMMGGDKDCSSKGIFGIHIGAENTYLLIVDPHFVGYAKSAQQLQKDYWVKWQNLNDFMDSSFYNLCLPQVVPKKDSSSQVP